MRSNGYFNHLCDLIWSTGRDKDSEETEDYELILLQILHSTDFYSLIPNDDNRCEDGLELRENYYGGEREGLLAPLSGPCTVLEMLIGLSFRLEFETAQSKWEKTPREWFWILIDNLDLGYCTNYNLILSEYTDKIHNILNIMVSRQYKGNGEAGGLFPLRHPAQDQRKVEIWYQMSAFLLENYPI